MYVFYQASMIVSLVVSLCVVVLMWRRHRSPGAASMIALGAATFVWTLGYLLATNGNTLEQHQFFTNVGYLGSMSVPVAWFIFALNYTNGRKLIAGWKSLYLCIVPAFITVLIWTNGQHHLMWYDEYLSTHGPFTITVKTYGTFFWVALAHNYLLVVSGGIILLRRLFVGAPLYTSQAVVLIVAVCLPWLWNIFYVFDLVPLRKDLTPVMFAISGIAIVLGLMRYRLFTTIPFARKYVIQQLNDGVLVFNSDNCLVEANPAALQKLGVTRSVIGSRLAGLIPLSPVFEHLSSAGFGCEELQLTVSGEKYHVEVETGPMLDRGEQQVGWLAIIHDITMRKEAEEQYRLITDYSADIIYRFTIANEQYTYVSPSVERLLGYTERELLALNPRDILTPESYKRQRDEMLKDVQRGMSHGTLQLEVIHKNGHIIPAEVHASLIFDEKGEPVEIVGVVRDITERKKMEERIIMQDRLASIGQLTSGLAHELNNPLTSVVSLSELLLKENLPDDMRQDLQAINDDARRIANTVKNLLVFARKQPLQKRPTDINHSIEQVLELRTYEQKLNDILVDTRLAPDLPNVMGNDSQLQQVFFNIVVNAEYFMLEAYKKGTLTITTEKAGDCVRALFADCGPGIPRENMRYLFTPFYTTKEVGKGTGLSLSICLGIINEHNGRIWAESEPGKGSTFIVELPAYSRPAQEGDGV